MSNKHLIHYTARVATMLLLALLMLAAVPQRAGAQTTSNISYIDAEGNAQMASQVDVVNSSMGGTSTAKFSSAYDWFYVNTDVTLDGALNSDFTTQNIILGDGATLTINGRFRFSFASVNIYCQSGRTGRLVVNGTYGDAIFQVNNTLTINGGTVEVTNNAYRGSGFVSNLVMNGGTASFTCNKGPNNYAIFGNVTLNGGIFTATSGEWVGVCYETMRIGDGKYFKDGSSNIYSGTLTDAQKEALRGVTLSPATQAEYIQACLGAGNDGSASKPYTISNAEGWNAFCLALDDNDTWNRFSGKTVSLGDDIAVSRMAGSDKHDFCGTFDGDEHTITLDGNSANGCYTLFRNAVGATIRDLHVTGTITTAGKYAAGFISGMWGNVTIENCRSSVIIRSSVSGDGTHGGFVAVNNSGTLDITGCTFDGKLLTEGATATSHCGGFVGWNDGTLTLTNSLYAPADLADGETEISSEYTFARNGATLTNSYYTRALGTPQGKALRTIAAGDNVTIEAIALTGETTEYNISGIIAYSGGGLQFGSALYYGSGDQLELTLSNTATDAPLGYEYDGYTASAGTLSGSTLTMPDEDVTISLALAVIDWATESAGDADHPYMIYNKDQLDLLAHRVNGTHGKTLQSDGYSGKYFQLGADINYTYSKEWDEATSEENNFEAIGGNYGGYRYFRGDFDGAGHTISGIRIHRSGSNISNEYQGIFGYTNGANIHSLRLADARITGYDYTGGIVGYNYYNGYYNGTVTDCHVANDVCIHAVQTKAYYHGGIAGYNEGTVANCTSAATLTIPTSDTSCKNYGGIVGYNKSSGTLRDNLAIGATIPAADNYYGAIVGRNGGTLQRNYYTACKVASENVTPSGVGCGYIDDGSGNYTPADVTDNDGAVPALRDQADNTQAISLFAALAQKDDDRPVLPLNLGWGEGKFPMQIAGRTLYKDGAWNTLCLPFDVKLSGSVLDGAVARPLSEASISGTTLNLEFAEAVDELVAGTPYIIKWAKADGYVDDDNHNIVNPVFSGVTVSTDKHDYDTDEENVVTDERVRFIGTYKSTAFDSEDTSILLMGATNKLYYPTTGAGIGAQRAYFKIGNDEQTQLARLTSFNIDFDEEGVTTGIFSIDNGQLTIDKSWYTLDGRRLADKPTQKGMYINNGKVVVIK